MKYEDTVFDDGTEPTVRKVPLGCDQQGRYPEAAELCTSLNEKHFWKPWFGNQMRCIYCKRLWSFSDDEPGVKSPDDLTPFDWAALIIIGTVAAVTVVAGALAFLGGGV